MIFKPAKFVFTTLFFLLVFIFFGFFYKHHLYFEEQRQIFLFTKEHFLDIIRLPGGLAGYLGEFLTQFFYYPLAGAFIISLLLLLVQQLSLRIICKIHTGYLCFPFSFVPAILYWFILCDENNYLSGLVGFAISLLFILIYLKIEKGHLRLFVSFIGLIITYFLLGGAYISFTSIILIYEIIRYIPDAGKDRTGMKNTGSNNKAYKIFFYIFLATYPVIAIIFPLIARRHFSLMNKVQAYFSEFYYNIVNVGANVSVNILLVILLLIIPVLMIIARGLTDLDIYKKPAIIKHKKALLIILFILFILSTAYGLSKIMDVEAEEFMTYDYLLKNGEWEEIIKYGEEYPPKNYLTLSVFNLALSKTGQMSETMFQYPQYGVYSLIVPCNEADGFPFFGDEIFFQLGLVNASQHCTFEAMSSFPEYRQNLNVRSVKRLVETNLINGQYKVAEKYLSLLDKTLFYRSWSKEIRKLLYNEELIMKDPVYSEKIKQRISNDFFVTGYDFGTVMNKIIEEYPDNKMVVEYFLAYHLLNKDLASFIDNLHLTDSLQYKGLPKSYQEAIAIYFESASLNDNPSIALKYSQIDAAVIKNLQNFAYIFRNDPNAQRTLEQTHSNTYWYYLYYR